MNTKSIVTMGINNISMNHDNKLKIDNDNHTSNKQNNNKIL